MGRTQRGTGWTDSILAVIGSLYAFQWIRVPVGFAPWLIQKLELSSAETIMEPAFGGVVEHGETVEEGYAILGERVRVLGDAGVVDAGGDEGCEGEGEERGGQHGH